MIKTYIALHNTVKDILSNRKGVSHLLEVAGTLGLVALIIALVFPTAKTTVSNIWDSMIGKVQTFTNS